MGRERGAGLATVLLVMAVLGAIALTLAASTTFHLRLATHQSSAAQSRNLCESVLSMTVDRLSTQRDFGTGTTSNADSITVQFSPTNPVGHLSFHPAQATAWGVPVSVNNLENEASVVLADGRALPAFSAYLAAEADYGGVTRVVESVITIPKYKYALATSGRVVSNGRLLVASIDDSVDLSGGLGAVPTESLKPGHLAAQSTEQTVLDAASPSNGTLITGDVVAGGTVSLGTYTDVQGSVLQNHDPDELPDINVADYDPAGWVGLQTVGSSTLTGYNPGDSIQLSGMWRRDGDLDIYGPLDLDGGYIYVDGDLNITGGISGKGSIFCTGNISVGNASGFAADNVQALVAGGDINISGGNNSADRDSSFFSGILFSKGGMNLSNVTVVGSVINNSTDPQATLQLNNVGLLSDPTKIEFDFGIPGNTDTKFNGGSDNIFGIYPNAQDIAAHFSTAQDAYVAPDLSDLTYRVYRVGGMDSPSPSEYQIVGDFDNPQDIMQAVGDFMNGNGDWINAQETQHGIDAYGQWLTEKVSNLNDLYQRTKQESLKKGKFTLDPNQFIPFEERVRFIWSKERPSS